MTDRVQTPSLFYLSLSIKPEKFAPLKDIAEKHGLTASILEEPAGNTRGTRGSVSAYIRGNREVDALERMGLMREYYDASHCEKKAGGNPEKENKIFPRA